MISSRTDTPSNEKYTFVERNDREWNSKIKLKVATTLATPRRRDAFQSALDSVCRVCLETVGRRELKGWAKKTKKKRRGFSFVMKTVHF